MENNELLKAIGDMMDEKLDARQEKIDARFEKIDARFDKLEARQDRFEARQDSFEARQDRFEAEMGEVKDVLESVRLSTLETELTHYPRIQAALDRILNVAEENRQLDGRVRVLERKTAAHEEEILKLKAASGSE